VKLRSWCGYLVEQKMYGFANVSLLDQARFYEMSSRGIKRSPRLLEAGEVREALYGQGFSYLYSRSILAKARHDTGADAGSDLVFANQCLEHGVRMGFVDDVHGLAVQLIQAGSSAVCFAQHLIRAASLSKIATITPLPPDLAL
jgi:hypothetical protein